MTIFTKTEAAMILGITSAEITRMADVGKLTLVQKTKKNMGVSEEDVQKLQKELQIIRDIRTEIFETEIEIRTLGAEIKTLELKFQIKLEKAISKKIKDIHKYLTTIKNSKKEHKEEIKTLKDNLAKKRKDLAELKSELKYTKEDDLGIPPSKPKEVIIENLDTKNPEKAQKQYKSLKKKYIKLKEKYDELDEYEENIIEQYVELRKQYSKLKKDYAQTAQQSNIWYQAYMDAEEGGGKKFNKEEIKFILLNVHPDKFVQKSERIQGFANSVSRIFTDMLEKAA